MRATRYWLGLIMCCVASTRAAAQHDGTTLVVVVGDPRNGSFILDAEVSVLRVGLHSRTDSLGQARIPGVPAGTFIVEARRLGYAPVAQELTFSGRDSMEITMLMHSSVQSLPPVSVTDSAARSPILQEFEQRRRNHIGGYFVTEQEIDGAFGSNIADFATRKIPGIKIEFGSDRTAHVYSTRGPNSIHGQCEVAVFVNGVRLTLGDAALVPLEQLGGIEYYPTGFVPVQYRVGSPLHGGGSAACGVMLLWTRR